MKTLSGILSAAIIVVLFLAAFTAAYSISIIPTAVAVSATPSAAADQCVQKIRGVLYSQISNARNACAFDGRKLLVADLGRMIPATEGVYKMLGERKECRIGKGGFVLSCKR